MKFQVINEALRFGSVAPGLLRKTTKDIQVKGKVVNQITQTSYIHFFFSQTENRISSK